MLRADGYRNWEYFVQSTVAPWTVYNSTWLQELFLSTNDIRKYIEVDQRRWTMNILKQKKESILSLRNIRWLFSEQISTRLNLNVICEETAKYQNFHSNLPNIYNSIRILHTNANSFVCVDKLGCLLCCNFVSKQFSWKIGNVVWWREHHTNYRLDGSLRASLFVRTNFILSFHSLLTQQEYWFSFRLR